MRYYHILLKNILLASFILLLSNCSFDGMKKVSDDKFIGVWELKGRSMLDGIKISIERTESGSFVGKVLEINSNKYVNLFLETGDVLVSNIKRSSNFQFRLTEMKIGAVLFSTYGLDTSKEFKLEFIDDNTIGLSSGNSDPLKSKVFYKRIK